MKMLLEANVIANTAIIHLLFYIKETICEEARLPLDIVRVELLPALHWYNCVFTAAGQWKRHFNTKEREMEDVLSPLVISLFQQKQVQDLFVCHVSPQWPLDIVPADAQQTATQGSAVPAHTHSRCHFGYRHANQGNK